MQITIHGDNGSGKSTLAKLLAKLLDYRHFSTGDFARELAEKAGFDSIKDFMAAEREKNTSFDIDDVIDGRLREELALYSDIVIDSRMGYFFAKDSIKIYCILDSQTAARWIWDGDKRRAETFASVGELSQHLIGRKETDRLVYMQKYGTDYTDTTQFDEIILSSQFENRKEEMVNHTLGLIEKVQKKRDSMLANGK